MRRNNSELIQDGWVSFSDILTVLVCGLLFIGMVNWNLQNSRERNAAEIIPRLEYFKAQVEQIQKDVLITRAGIEKAKSFAAVRTQKDT